MAKKPLSHDPKLAVVPLNIFADQIAAMQVGPYVAKFTLSVVENNSENEELLRPVVTIAMPTINLMQMVADLHELFNNPEFKRDSAKILAEDSIRFFDAKSKMSSPPQLKSAKPISK